jgi:hypothetical protein
MSQHHSITGCKIPAFTLFFLLYTEFTESACQYILAGCQSIFDNFKKGFYKF